MTSLTKERKRETVLHHPFQNISFTVTPTQRNIEKYKM